VGLIAPHEQASGWARFELVSVQTLHGIAEGLFIGGIADADELMPATALLGGIAGGVGSYYFTRKGISHGPAMSINAGTSWGMVNGLLFMPRLESSEARWGSMLVFTTAGTGLGILIANELRPRAGQVAMTNSMGFWSGVLASELMLATERHRDPRLFNVLLVATNAGLAGGMVLSIFHPMSRLRALLIDVGGLLGTLFGAGLSFVLADDFHMPTLGACGAGGTLAGLVLGTYLTREVDRDEVPPLTFMPLVGRKGELGVMVGMSF
jgi:hypothetical protein